MNNQLLQNDIDAIVNIWKENEQLVHQSNYLKNYLYTCKIYYLISILLMHTSSKVKRIRLLGDATFDESHLQKKENQIDRNI